MRALAGAALLFFLGACAAGPRPMPSALSAPERLAFSEAVLDQARGVSATFEIEAEGSKQATLTGTLHLVSPNALSLVAEGTFAGESVKAELDSRSGEVNRSTSKGAEVSGHRDPPAPALTLAVCLGLTRMGLLHNVARLIGDQGVDHAQGGVDGWVKAVDVKEGGPDTVASEPCHRLTFGVEVQGKRSGEASLCLSDATSLPLHRRQTVHLDDGELTVVETLHWTVK